MGSALLVLHREGSVDDSHHISRIRLATWKVIVTVAHQPLISPAERLEVEVQSIP
jgi:hypothetical protein